MMQLDFFLSEKERDSFVQYCFKNDCSIVPNRHYDTDRYIVTTDIDQYQTYCSTSPLLFVTSKKFSTYPLELDYLEEGSQKKFFIKQRYGGPTIDFFSPVLGELEENIIGPGYIGIYPYYYFQNKKYVPNRELANLYKLFAAYIKSSSQKIKLTNRTYWVGNYTIQKVKTGELKLLPMSGVDLSQLV